MKGNLIVILIYEHNHIISNRSIILIGKTLVNNIGTIPDDKCVWKRQGSSKYNIQLERNDKK